MQWLPPIAPEAASFRLPISAVGAWEATAALATEDLEAARALWKRALRWEPALLLWTVGCAERCSVSVHSMDEAASWLAEARDDAWRDVSIPDHLDNSFDRSQAIAWSRRVASALARSQVASRLTDRCSRPKAEFCALLAEAKQWLPAELSSSSPKQIAAMEGAWPDGQSVGSASGRPCKRLRKKVRRRWLSSKSASATSFLSATSQILKARKLQDAFSKQLHEEKMASLAQLAYGATHEINNPLANIATRAQSLLVDEKHPERRRTLATIHSQAMRAYEMIANMMLFARPPVLECEAIDGAILLKEAALLLADEAASQQTAVHLAVDGEVRFCGDRRQLMVALRAAVQNGLEAVVSGGEVRLTARRVPQLSNEGVRLPIELTVSDTGPGLDANALRHAFDPFFSGREAGRGLGFGLSWCWRIITRHGGTIELTNQEQCGARLVIRLPETPAAE